MSMHVCRKALLAAAFAFVAATVTPASASEAINETALAQAPASEAAALPGDAFARKRQNAVRHVARPASADPEIARLVARLAALTGARPCNYLGCPGYVVVGVQY